MDGHGEAHPSCRAQWIVRQCGSCGDVILTLVDTDTGTEIATKLPNVETIDAMIGSLERARAGIVARDASRN